MMDIVRILANKYPDRKWALNGDAYEGLVALDGLPLPTLVELETAWPEVEAKINKDTYNAPLLQQLEEIDKKRIRAVCEDDKEYLTQYNNEAKAIRAQLRK